MHLDATELDIKSVYEIIDKGKGSYAILWENTESKVEFIQEILAGKNPRPNKLCFSETKPLRFVNKYCVVTDLQRNWLTFDNAVVNELKDVLKKWNSELIPVKATTRDLTLTYTKNVIDGIDVGAAVYQEVPRNSVKSTEDLLRQTRTYAFKSDVLDVPVFIDINAKRTFYTGGAINELSALGIKGLSFKEVWNLDKGPINPYTRDYITI